jgi:cytoskeletal protein CcmA (bactofilin family)
MSETNVQLFPGVFRTTQGGSNPDFFLHSAGRVGIGNDAPDTPPAWNTNTTFKLNVTGHTHINGNLDVTGYLYGDGSTLSGVAAVVGGYWDLDQANNNIKYDVGNVGIGGAAGTEKLTVHGDLNLNGGNLKLNGQTAVFSNWTSHTNGIYRSTNVGIGGDPSSTNKLKVHGTVEATDLTVSGDIRLNSTGTAKIFNHFAGSDYGNLQISSGYQNAAAAPKIDLIGYTGAGTVDGDNLIKFSTNNSVRMFINQSGNVGMGGNPGTEKLKVHGAMTVEGQTRTSSPTVVKTWNAFNNNTSQGEYTFEARAVTLAHFHYSSGEDVNISESYLISCSDSSSPTVTILKHAGYLHLQVYSDRKVRFWAQGLPSNYNSSNFNLRISAIWKIS